MADARRARFVHEYVYGAHAGNATASYKAAGYSPRGADAGAIRLLGNVRLRADIDRLTAERDAALRAEGIARREERLRLYNDTAAALTQIKAERAADAKLRGAAGGSSGLVTRRFKTLPNADPGKPPLTVTEDSVDTGWITALLATLRQAATEAGQWAEKREVSGPDGGPIVLLWPEGERADR